tara:strand:- start:562 stop:915 length:354 start_codon:yes stop_codon:yes gene_type:complete
MTKEEIQKFRKWVNLCLSQRYYMHNFHEAFEDYLERDEEKKTKIQLILECVMIRCCQSETLLEEMTKDLSMILPRLENRCNTFKRDFGDIGESNIKSLLYDEDEEQIYYNAWENTES